MNKIFIFLIGLIIIAASITVFVIVSEDETDFAELSNPSDETISSTEESFQIDTLTNNDPQNSFVVNTNGTKIKLDKAKQNSGPAKQILDPNTLKLLLKKPDNRKKLSDQDYKNFASLRKKFPGSSLFPKKLTPEEAIVKKNIKMELAIMGGMIQRGEATPSDINRYYDSESKKANDKLEFLQYVSQRSGGNISDAMQKTINHYKKRITTVNSSREAALENAQ